MIVHEVHDAESKLIAILKVLSEYSEPLGQSPLHVGLNMKEFLSERVYCSLLIWKLP
jgi:hypothetical protein